MLIRRAPPPIFCICAVVSACVCVCLGICVSFRANNNFALAADTEFNYAKSFASLFLYTNIVKKITQVIAELLSVILIKMQTSAFAF